ncbi:Serine/threonine kinase [Orbilia ellipsospora]|uniref:protein kinase C n=1 Tax=Orbilia ellipsospora TaxID=2528407 RepID=A0AAV9XCY3_9PEZI
MQVPATNSGGAGDDDAATSVHKKIDRVHQKIERERVLITAARSMRQSTDNASVQQSLDSKIRESQSNINYLEGVIRDLQNKQIQSVGAGIDSLSLTSTNAFSESPPTPPPKSQRDIFQESDYGAVPGGGPKPPFAQPGPGMSKSRPNYSKLDLIKYDSPYLGPRITLMLSQLEFKLSVEKQYKEGIEKMAKLYQMEGDRRSRADADSKRVESNQKIHLLKQALKRYEDLHVDVEGDTQGDDDSINAPNIRRPLTGRLHIKILAVKDVDHAATSRFSRGPETFVTVKVEDVVRTKTKPSKTDRWDESSEVDVDKANEIEITVYDRSGDHHLPIGLMWVRLSDIVEEQRRKRIEQDISATGWVSADNMEASTQGTYPTLTGGSSSLRTAGNMASGSTGTPQNAIPGVANQGLEEPKPVVIDAWFVLEPVGQIRLQLSFVKYNKNKRPFDVGLNRKGAVRKQKEEVHETYGHKFVQQQFYNIMRCALCGDFLKYSVGYQCADCKYTCHKKCYPKVVTKCISKSNAETDPEEEKLNHRIPHRFEPTTNFGANWCCHCGYMLPVGKKNARKCTECQLTCHAQCAHLVPDFCGMSMEVANRILSEMGKMKRNGVSSSGHMATQTLRPSQNTPTSTRPTSIQSSRTESLVDSQASEPRMTPVSAQSTQSPTSSISGQSTLFDTSQPQGFDGKGAYNAAAKAYGPYSPIPPPPPPPPQARPQSGQRSPSNSLAAAAAITALTGSRPASGGRPTVQPAPYNPAMMPNIPTMYQQQQLPVISPALVQDQQQRVAAGYIPPPPPPLPLPPQTAPTNPIPPQAQIQPYTSTGNPTLQKPANYTTPISGSPQPTQQTKAPRSESSRKIGLDHFNFLAVLGKGNFGKVMLAETKATKQLYAIKVLKKEFIIENDEVESIRSEKRVFLIANKERHPFLLNLHACFQTETRVYFVMEYISGGDLMLHIQRGQFGTKRAQFYAAEVCLALKYFHENGVIYRDLKLDNILLTLDGHIKIGDYGLCKEEMWYGSTTSTFCGTPEFMAPEILLDKRYGRAVDWWAFGVLIYQMLLQQSPFRGEDEDEIYDAILSDEPLYPIHMPRDSVSILQKLLTREPELRLGSGPTDAQEIMSHAFFRNVNWDDIYHKRVPSPFLPQISSPTDTSNFDQEFTSVTPVLTPVQSVLTQAMQEEFRGFSYTADFV